MAVPKETDTGKENHKTQTRPVYLWDKRVKMEQNKEIYQSWSLIIMAYNEAHTIEKVSRHAMDFLSPSA